MKTDELLIKELAEKTDLNPKTIRFYESINLIPEAKRNQSNYRIYSENDLKRLQFIKKARNLGISIDEIKSILEIREKGSMPCYTVISILEKHEIEVANRIIELEKFKEKLSNTLNKFKKNMDIGKSGEICGLIENLFEQ